MNRMTMIEKGCEKSANSTNNDAKNCYEETPPNRPRVTTTSSPQRRPSLLGGLKNMWHSRSMGEKMFRRNHGDLAGGRKVQIADCEVDDVYDLRHKNDNSFYDDDTAFRRPRSNSSDFLILRKTSRPLSVNVVGLIDQQTDPYRQYMKVVDVYELCPQNSKIHVIDKKLSTQKAFSIVKKQKVGSLLVWDSSSEELLSIVTLTDFFNCLQNSEKDGRFLVENILSGNQLVTVDISTKILDACHELLTNKLHRIAVRDELGNIVFMFTIRRVLAAIHKQNRSLHFAQWLSRPIGMSNIGTWSDIKSIGENMPIWRAVEEMIGCRFSTMPIVDDQKNMIGVLTKRDICNALPDDNKSPKKWMKDTKISAILAKQENPPQISSKDTIGSVLDQLLSSTCHTVFVIHNQKPIGAVSLSDFLEFLMSNPISAAELPMTPGSSDSSSENIRGAK